MYTKCLLFNLINLKPLSVSDTYNLKKILEHSTVFFITKKLIDKAYSSENIYCNSVSINIQRDLIFETHKFSTDPEMFVINKSIQEFVDDVLDTFHMASRTDSNLELNIEVVLLSRYNVAISYDIF